MHATPSLRARHPWLWSAACITLLLAALVRGLYTLPLAHATSPEAVALAQQIAELTNVERAARGLPPLKLEDDLLNAALWIAQDNADYDYFSHVDRLGRDIVQRFGAFGYSGYSTIGENLAAGSTTPAGAIAQWLDSPGHRDNMLSAAFCEIGGGYGYSAASTYRHYWSQAFGCRAGFHPVIINGEAARTSSAAVSLYIYGAGWAQQMRLSNDGVTWTAWEPYQPGRSWNLLAGGGPRTVYVELRNGSTVRAASDTILLEAPPVTQTPTATSTATATTTATPQATGIPADQRLLYLPLLRKGVPPPTATPRPLASATPTQPAQPPALPTGWRERVNAYRALAGVPPVSEDTTLSDNCFQHARYMAENNELTHEQVAGRPWASAAGQSCAQNGNVMIGSGTWQAATAVDGWMGSVGHRLWLLYPTTPTFGFGLHSNGQRTGAALDVLSRSRFQQDDAYAGWPVRYPAAGQSGVPARALPITLQWPYFGEAPLLTATSLRTLAGVSIAHTATTALPAGHKGVLIEPAQALPAGATIEVVVEGSYKGAPLRLVWTFTTGS